METGVIVEYTAKCSECNWHGHKFGNRANANAEANMHIANLKHEEVEVSESEIKNNYPEMTEEEAKLIFIRKSAQEAFEKGEIEEATKGILKVIVEITFVSNMTKEEIGSHIGNLEKAKAFLAAFTQGLQIGYAKEAEPIFKAKREREKQQKLAEKLTSSKDKKVNELIEMARRLSLGEDSSQKPKVVASKVKCEKCGNEVYSLKFHKC